MKNYTYLVRKLFFLPVFFLLISYNGISQSAPPGLTAQGLTASNGVFIGFEQFIPLDYNTNTSHKYPLIIFLHGIGERGNGTTQLGSVLANGIANDINAGNKMTFFWNGKWETFIVLMPQLSTAYGWWYNFYVDAMLAYAKNNLRVDTNRIILTGLSLGGGGVWSYAGTSDQNASTFSALGISCGTCQSLDWCTFARAKVPIWAFHAQDDGTVSVGCTQGAISSIMACNPAVKPYMTIWPNGNHFIWGRVYDTAYAWQNPNIYEWFLGQDKSLPVNMRPIANAGPDLSTTTNPGTVVLNASGSKDLDGTLQRFIWRNISGPPYGTIQSPVTTNGITLVSGLIVPGTYQYEVKVVDDRCDWTFDTVNVTVTSGPPPPNQNPVANAGASFSINLPTNSASLNGSASYDPDGTIAFYTWKEVGGPAQYSIGSPNSANTSITNLVTGLYTFQLTVTDNLGAQSSSTVQVTVLSLLPPNQPPIANAGNDINITLPTNSTTLNGSASADPDGTINTYQWTKISGPAQGTISSPAAATSTLTGLVQGTYSFRLLVTDNGGLTDDDTVNVTVNPAPNQPPVANAGADINITLPTNNTSLNGSGSSDPDGTISTYQWSLISGPAQFNITNPAAATTALTNLVQGTYKFRLFVTDNGGLTDDDTVMVTVNPAPNQAPVANAGADITITLPTNNTTLNGGASSDPDGTISTYQWTMVSGPAQYSITTANAASTSVTNLVQGIYLFKLVVTDNGGLSSSDTVQVTVNAVPPPPNQSPIANAGADINITLPVNNTTLDGSSSSDPDGTIVSYAWSKLSGPAQYTIANSSAATTALTNLAQGTYMFRLVVTDNGSATGDDTVMVTVNPGPPPPDQAPIANAGTDIILTLPTNNTTLNGTASSDPDGTISTYQWTMISGPAQYSIANATAASTALTNLVQGTYLFQLTVTDNGGLSSSDTVQVNVVPAPPPSNQLPVANAGSDITITLPVDSVTLNGTASFDPDGTIAAYSWWKISGPSSFNIVSPNGSTTIVNNLIAGTYLVALTVWDNQWSPVTDTVMITVNPAPNQPPVANAGSDITIILPINNTTLNGNASSDPDGMISTYQWTKISGPAQYTIANPGAVSTALTNLVQGTYTFRLLVTDNGGLTAVDTMVVTVNAALPPPNQAPIANAGTDINITLPTNNTTLDGSGSSDPDGTIVSYAWSKISGPAQFTLVNPSAATTALTNMVQGIYSFRLVVTDNGGLTDDDTIVVTVNPAPNQAPVANAGADINITLPTNNTTLDGSGSHDPDGTISTYQWSLVSGPAQYTIANSAAGSTALTNLVQGTYTFSLLVTDNGGLTATDTVVVTVNPAPPPPNQPPVSNAGADINITLPTNSTTLDGSGSKDPDGTISTYQWTKISGPTQGTIANPTGATTALTNLVAGTYSFRLFVTDNGGLTDADTVVVTVNPAPPPPNQPPVANAGADINITLPTNSTTLDGTASSDPDGSISSYGWTVISGPAQYTIVNPGSGTTAFSNLVQGTYKVVLLVTDNGGLMSTDTVVVTVNPGPPPPNQPPVANAGADINITLPTNSVTLNGSGSSDPDGTISTYQWIKISGPAQGSISNPSLVSTTVTSLVQGTYSFRLLVTDNGGLTDDDTIVVTVNPAPNQSPVANAGNDTTVSLPNPIISLVGSASYDPDGTIASYNWVKVSGPGSLTIVNSTNDVATVVGVQVGTYVFQLTVTDNNGASATDQVTLTVLAAVNRKPVANAGNDTTIAVPSTIAWLNGSGSYDPDGTIATYSWRQVSGPSTAMMASAVYPVVSVGALQPGDYVFELTVTDNNGAIGVDSVTISVVNYQRTGISDSLLVYPSPASSIVHIRCTSDTIGVVKLNIYDLNGKLVRTLSSFKAQYFMDVQMTVSDIQAGIYLVEVVIGDKKHMLGKFMRQ